MNFNYSSPPAKIENRFFGITMGCPVGIGPEIILKLFADSDYDFGHQPVVLGDRGVLERCARELALAVDIVQWRPDMEFTGKKSPVVPVLSLSNLEVDKLVWGRPDKETGLAMAGYITEAVRLTLKNDLVGIVTCPIAKSTLNLAGYQFPGHTEMLASLCGTNEYAMMMAGNKLRVALVTIHTSLDSVSELINREKILRLISLTRSSLQVDFGVTEPCLAVAGFNPHAGEGGLFGKEEERYIEPAVSIAVRKGWDVHGPLPPDTVFYKAMNGKYDAVICMYHDQGLIPFKLLHFADGVNVTLGLPVVRTSVDHGTAYDIAGKGIADPASLKAACRLALEIADNRNTFSKESEAHKL